MATPSAGDLRNFATAGHASSGKTTLSEAMLACAGVIGRMGNIAQGTTVSDCHVSEKQHQISTQTSLLHVRPPSPARETRAPPETREVICRGDRSNG
jgi:translation elongation factor EF-G